LNVKYIYYFNKLNYLLSCILDIYSYGIIIVIVSCKNLRVCTQCVNPKTPQGGLKGGFLAELAGSNEESGEGVEVRVGR
jgi:hypothetical protein